MSIWIETPIPISHKCTRMVDANFFGMSNKFVFSFFDMPMEQRGRFLSMEKRDVVLLEMRKFLVFGLVWYVLSLVFFSGQIYLFPNKLEQFSLKSMTVMVNS